MIPFPDRMRSIFSALQTSAHKFANQHELNRSSVFNLLDVERRPSFDLVERICLAEPRISAEFILRGEGDPLRIHAASGSITTVDQLRAIQAELNLILEKRIQELDSTVSPEGE